MNNVDYSRVIQPQEDGYDIQFFQQLKVQRGFVKKEFPYISRYLSGMGVWSWNKDNLSAPYNDDTAQLQRLETIAPQAAPLIWNNITNLVDIFTPIHCIDGNEYSCQHAAVDYPHSWIVMAPLTNDPTVTVRNLFHEMIHWKFTTLGFGKGCTPEIFDMLEHNNEFVLNPLDELHHSIVNSYADTAQPSVGNKPTGRPISASIHAYGSFIGEAHVALQFAKYNISEYYRWLGYAKKWGSRLEESMEALMLHAKTTPKGAQLLLGLYKWTKQYQEEYTDTIKTLSKLV
jgi:hypothetical protein